MMQFYELQCTKPIVLKGLYKVKSLHLQRASNLKVADSNRCPTRAMYCEDGSEAEARTNFGILSWCKGFFYFQELKLHRLESIW